MNKEMIELINVKKKYGDFVAVKNLDLKVKKGQIFGLLGPNGAGKSTTIRMIIGVLEKTEGSIFVDGIDVSEEPDLVKKNIGYMSQKFSLYEDLTVLENLNFYASIYGVRGRDKEERIKQLITMANLNGKEKVLASQLSGGWKQRLALGCALIHRPKLLILDEPTAGVDPVSRRIFWKMIFELSNQGITVLVSTHYMDEAESCDIVGFIFKGELLAIDTPENLKVNEKVNNLEEVFIKYVEKLTGESIDTSFKSLKFIKGDD
jgi:ABC-2 type transport system ATP-binding protein